MLKAELMERKTFSKVQIYVRNAYNKAAESAKSGDYDAAIATLIPVVIYNPEVPQLFDRLREYEIAKTKKMSSSQKIWCQLLASFRVPFVYLRAMFDPQEAMAMCEKPLGKCVDQPLLLTALAFAANRCDAPWIEATAYNVIRVFHPGNDNVLRKLAAAMQRNNQAQDALKIFQMLARKYPDKLSVQNELREAMAMASLESGSWEKEGSTQNKANDAQDAVIQQLLEGTIHDAEQAQVLIDRFNDELAKNDSIDMRRKLADAYMIKGDYEEAYNQYKLVSAKLGVLDPVLDKQIERAYVAMLKSSVDMLRDNPDAYEDAEGQISQLEKELFEYQKRHVFNRAKRFPNDMQLQYDLAEFYYHQNDFAEARRIFELVAENPLKRRASLVYIARCCLKTGQPDAAIPLLEEALRDMFRMDKYKREALYYLGVAQQETGNAEGALANFRQIQSSMENYRDIGERIAQLTKSE